MRVIGREDPSDRINVHHRAGTVRVLQCRNLGFIGLAHGTSRPHTHQHSRSRYREALSYRKKGQDATVPKGRSLECLSDRKWLAVQDLRELRIELRQARAVCSSRPPGQDYCRHAYPNTNQNKREPGFNDGVDFGPAGKDDPGPVTDGRIRVPRGTDRRSNSPPNVPPSTGQGIGPENRGLRVRTTRRGGGPPKGWSWDKCRALARKNSVAGRLEWFNRPNSRWAGTTEQSKLQEGGPQGQVANGAWTQAFARLIGKVIEEASSTAYTGGYERCNFAGRRNRGNQNGNYRQPSGGGRATRDATVGYRSTNAQTT